MTTEQRTASADAQQIPTDIRPQDDLYLHVNGDWIASHTIPDDRSADGVIRGLFDVAEEKVRDIITHAGESSGSDAAAEEAQKVADRSEERRVGTEGRAGRLQRPQRREDEG